jgi:hypothetical protein
VTVRTLLFVTLFAVADILTDVVVETGIVVITKAADFWPPVMVMADGTLATLGLELCRETESP